MPCNVDYYHYHWFGVAKKTNGCVGNHQWTGGKWNADTGERDTPYNNLNHCKEDLLVGGDRFASLKKAVTFNSDTGFCSIYYDHD